MYGGTVKPTDGAAQQRLGHGGSTTQHRAGPRSDSPPSSLAGPRRARNKCSEGEAGQAGWRRQRGARGPRLANDRGRGSDAYKDVDCDGQRGGNGLLGWNATQMIPSVAIVRNEAASSGSHTAFFSNLFYLTNNSPNKRPTLSFPFLRDDRNGTNLV